MGGVRGVALVAVIFVAAVTGLGGRAILGQQVLAQGGVSPTPTECRTFGTAYCDVIVFDVSVPPEYANLEAPVYFVSFAVSWQDTEVEGTGLNDVDVYVYDAQERLLRRDGATGANPETTALENPAAGRYQLVVNNLSGTNQGYSVKAEFVPDEADYGAPSECDFADNCSRPTAAPTSRPTTPTTSTKPAAAVGSGSTPAPAGGAATPTSRSRPSLPPVAVEGDNDFTAFGDDTVRPIGIAGRRNASASRPDEASGAEAAAWLGIPGAVLMAGALGLRRRGVGQLRVDLT